MDISLIIGIFISLILSAFFSGMEIAFISSNRMLVEMDKEKNGIAQKCLQIFYRNPNGFVSTMLVGNNIVLVLYGILFANIFNTTLFLSYSPVTQVLLNTVLSTIIVVFIGEFMPKVIFKSNPNTLLSFFAPLAYLFFITLWPISRLSIFMAHIMLKLIGVKIDEEKSDNTFTKVDLDYLLQSSIDDAKDDGTIEEEVKIFQNALEFTDTKVKDCMIPRTEIQAVDITCSTEELQQKFIESGNSKIVVYKGNIDHIEGYIHSSEMFKNSKVWREHIRKMPFVPETMTAQKLMHMFLQQKKSLGIVIDEFGGTSGIVSLEDIVEEIFGDIEDEHDNAKYIAKKIADNEYILSARLEIEKVNDMFDLDLPESDDYMTISGFILHEYQSFPKLNELIKIGRYEFKIIKNTMTKIELVKLKVYN